MVKENPNKESCRERMKELIRIKKSSRTALMCLDNDRKNDFIMYFSKNTEVKETNIFTVI